MTKAKVLDISRMCPKDQGHKGQGRRLRIFMLKFFVHVYTVFVFPKPTCTLGKSSNRSPRKLTVQARLS